MACSATGISPGGPHKLSSSRKSQAMVVTAAAQTPQAPSKGGAGSFLSRRARLLGSLAEQARRDVWDSWLADLVLPLVTDNPMAKSPPPVTRPARELAEPDSQFATVDGVSLHYKQAWPAAASSAAASPPAVGSLDRSKSTAAAASSMPTAVAETSAASADSDRPVVLLIHGFNGSVFNWRLTLQALADDTGCRVIAFDRPPFGLAERPLSWGQPGQALQYNPYTPGGAARLAAGLLDSLGVRSVLPVGHSAGALVAMELAQLQPWRIAGLGFVAPALPTTPANSFTRRANLGQQLRLVVTRALLANDTLGLRYVRRQILRRRDEVAAGRLGIRIEEPEVPQDIIDGYLRPLQADNWDRGALLNLRAFSMPPSYDYSSLTQPVLLVQGTEDGMLARNAQLLAELLHQRPVGSTEFLEMQGVGHVPMDERPRDFNSLLAAFVRKVADGTAARS